MNKIKNFTFAAIFATGLASVAFAEADKKAAAADNSTVTVEVPSGPLQLDKDDMSKITAGGMNGGRLWRREYRRKRGRKGRR